MTEQNRIDYQGRLAGLVKAKRFLSASQQKSKIAVKYRQTDFVPMLILFEFKTPIEWVCILLRILFACRPKSKSAKRFHQLSGSCGATLWIDPAKCETDLAKMKTIVCGEKLTVDWDTESRRELENHFEVATTLNLINALWLKWVAEAQSTLLKLPVITATVVKTLVSDYEKRRFSEFIREPPALYFDDDVRALKDVMHKPRKVGRSFPAV